MSEEVQTESKPVVPVGDIRIQIGNQAIVFAPADDITAKEVSLVFQMFLNGLMHRGEAFLDFGGFIASKNLQRHFAEIKDEPQKSEENTESN